MARAKKPRRAKKKRIQSRPTTVAPKAAVVAPQPKSVSFAEEYQYVIADLKRIFILAACMLALLIVLALVLQ
jgi:hypothetical protein